MGGLEPGGVLADRFMLRSECGSGGFGVVWRAEDRLAPDRDVAIKILREQHRADPVILGRFVREAEILSGLDHSGLAKIIAWDAHGPVAFIALEFIDGTPLGDQIWARSLDTSYFSIDEVRRLMVELVEVVEHAHARGIVHRDLKPQNIMSERATGRVRVLDFGVAKILDEDPSESTTSGRVIGSIQYMAPEHIMGRPIDGRADVFATGVILYEMLTLRRTWVHGEDGRPVPYHVRQGPNNGRVAIIGRVIHGERPRPSEIRPDLPGAIDDVILRAMAIDPGDRFENMRALELAIIAAASTTTRSVDPTRPIPIPVPAPVAIDLTAVAPRDLDGDGSRATTAPALSTTVAVAFPRPARARPIALAIGLFALAGVLAAIAGRKDSARADDAEVFPVAVSPAKHPIVAEPIPSADHRAPPPARDADRRVVPERRRRARTSRPRRATVPEVAALRADLSRIARSGSERFALAARIEKAAERLADPKDRTTAKRCAANASMIVEVGEAAEALGSCLDFLEDRMFEGASRSP
jgi:serine/threonine-protein kinase